MRFPTSFQLNSHALELLSAAIPYTSPNMQGMVSFLIKYKELQDTMHYIRHPPTMKACSFEGGKDNLLPLLTNIRPVCNPAERQTIDTLIHFIQSMEMINKYQDIMNSDSQSPMDAIKNMLPPEQQSMIDMYSMMFEQMNSENNN